MMYESFFEMEHTPFVRNVPAERLYASQQMEEQFHRLLCAATEQLFAVLYADAGCGKTTLIRKLSETLPKEEYLLLYVSDSGLTPRWLYRSLLEQLGLEPKSNRGDARRQLHKELEIIRGVQHKKVVCVLDEAHLLDKETLEEFRFLLNVRFDSENPMALILVGQTELWEQKLKLKRYSAIAERIDIPCVLPHLDRAETGQYIESHLAYAYDGEERQIFTDKAMDEIYKVSYGIPRMINRVCEKSLTYASQQRKKLVDDHMVRYVSEHEMVAIGT